MRKSIRKKKKEPVRGPSRRRKKLNMTVKVNARTRENTTCVATTISFHSWKVFSRHAPAREDRLERKFLISIHTINKHARWTSACFTCTPVRRNDPVIMKEIRTKQRTWHDFCLKKTKHFKQRENSDTIYLNLHQMEKLK